jgi:hypothetical protein
MVQEKDKFSSPDFSDLQGKESEAEAGGELHQFPDREPRRAGPRF